MSYGWFIARRLYGEGSGGRRASRTAIVIATAGVALGIAVMLLSLAVVMGFKSEVQKKVVGIGSHIVVQNFHSLYNADPQPIALSDSLIASLARLPEVGHVQRFCQKTGMLKTDDGFQGVAFRGIGADYDLTFLRRSLVEGEISQPFSSTESTGRLVVSQRIAQKLRLAVGSRVYAYFFDQNLRARRFTVQAIYATHLSEYDDVLLFCDYKTIHQLLGYQADQASGAEVALHDVSFLPQASEDVASLVNHRQDPYGQPLTSQTIRDTYPHIFAWLDLLDLNVLVILALMMAVACFTTVSGLLIIILERTQFVGIMKALGATNASLRRLFVFYALLIVGRGMLIGNLLGVGLCLMQQHFGFVRLDPSTYYVSAVPVQLSLLWFVVVNVATFLIATLVLMVPSLLVSRIRPAKSIRFE